MKILFLVIIFYLLNMSDEEKIDISCDKLLLNLIILALLNIIYDKILCKYYENFINNKLQVKQNNYENYDNHKLQVKQNNYENYENNKYHENKNNIFEVSPINLQESNNIIPKLGLCSKKCCPNYYKPQLPDIIDNRINSNDIGTKYITSNISCSDGVRDIGCVCIDKDILKYRYDTKNNELKNYDFLGTDTNKQINHIPEPKINNLIPLNNYL
jgi:hypothetical protein